MKFRFSQKRPFDITGIGRNSWDRIVVVERFPKPDEKMEALAVDNQPGGQVATSLVAATRLGATARYLGKFGDDAAGRAVRGALVREGVDLTASKVVHEVANQASFVVVDRKHRTRNVFGFCDERLRVTTDDFDPESVTSGNFLFLGGRVPADMVPFAKQGREAGCVVVVATDALGHGITDLLEIADVVIAPRLFALEFSGRKRLEDAMADISVIGPPLVCCTRGAEGAIALSEGRFSEAPSPEVEVLDTTGAGDVFQGAFLVALLENMPIEKALPFSCAAAALKCLKLGGQQGIPTRKELSRFLARKA